METFSRLSRGTEFSSLLFSFSNTTTRSTAQQLNFPCNSSHHCRVRCCSSSDSESKTQVPPMTASSAYEVLGVDPDHCSPSQLKSAFRSKASDIATAENRNVPFFCNNFDIARAENGSVPFLCNSFCSGNVKQFHPDVTRGGQSCDMMIRRVIEAYEILSNYSRSEIIERECMDPFDQPECEALDLFVNEVLCIGKGCPYSCVDRAPHAFKYSSVTGTARAFSQGHGEDYQVGLAVGQCPRSCIHYVTPSQRIILEELLDNILNMPYDTSAEADLLYSLIVKAKFENKRYKG